jgi:hypothetical protein
MKIFSDLIEGIVGIIAIISSLLFTLLVVAIVFSPLWFPFIVLLFLIKHW